MLRDAARGALRGVNKVLSPIDNYFAKGGISIGAPLFIIGAPRSGTTLTYQIVTQQLRVGYFTGVMNYLYGMPNLVTRVLKPFYQRPAPVYESVYGKTSGVLSPAENSNFWFRWFPRDGEQGHYVEPGDLQVDLYKELKATIDSISRINGKRMVFKNLYLSMVVGVLAQVFPEARFIFVRRNRLHTCKSLFMARNKQDGSRGWWSVKIPQYHQLQSTPLWYQVVEQVIRCEQIIENDLDRFASDRYLTIHYEDLCIHPHQVVRCVEEWATAAGYATYNDIRVPVCFRVSEEKTVSTDIVEKMREQLDRPGKDISE